MLACADGERGCIVLSYRDAYAAGIDVVDGGPPDGYAHMVEHAAYVRPCEGHAEDDA